MCFYGLLRKSNAVPKSSKYDPTKVLVRRNLIVDPVKKLVLMYVGFSKTNQFGASNLVVPIPGNNDPVLDPVKHVDLLFQQVKVGPEAPAFSVNSTEFVNYNTFTSRLRSLLTKAGYNAALYSGHSFCRGGATFLHSCGGSVLMVQASGDWSSQCFTRYLHLSLAERWKAQLLMSDGVSSSRDCQPSLPTAPHPCLLLLSPTFSDTSHFFGLGSFNYS